MHTPVSPKTWQERAFIGLCWIAVCLPLFVLIFLIGQTLVHAMPRLGFDFLGSFPSRKPELAGIYPALMGSLSLIVLTIAFALPIGVATALYLEEYARQDRLGHWIEVNISNLAGVPSIIYGLLGLEIFVRVVGLGRSLLAGAATMALLVLPVIIMATRESLRTVPNALREAGAALGSTRWQTTYQIVLPIALPGVLTGAILAVSRAIGETAPIIIVGAVAYVAFVPDSLSSPYTVLPLQIFNWISRPQPGFAVNAGAGIIALIGALFLLNITAIIFRARLERKIARSH